MALEGVTHCIFDLDGTIFNTEKVYFESIDGVLRQFGKRHSLDLCRQILGRTRQDYSKIIVQNAKLPITPKEFLERMDVISHSMFLNSVLLPGAERLIRHLHSHGVPMAVGTSSNLASVDLKFAKHADLKSRFHHMVSGTDDTEVSKGKPAPDVFLVAAQRFDPAPEPAKCLVFEDAPNGVRAGLAAGMQVVMIPDLNVVTDEQRQEPTICLKSLEEFKPELFGLPPFRDEAKEKVSSIKAVTHCIFDLDGTVFNTEKVYFASIDGALRQFGKRHSLELCRKIIGRTRQDYSKIIVEEANLPITPEEFLQRMDAISHSMFLNSTLMPGARKVIRHLHKHNIPIAIGTSSNLASVDLKFTHYKDIEAWFHHTVSGTDDPEVHQGKPAPDVFLVAAKRFSPTAEPGNCLVFEDAPNGVRAALAAGMQVVMIPDPIVVTETQRKEATICIDSLEEFRPEMFGLPAFKDEVRPKLVEYSTVATKSQRELSPTGAQVREKQRTESLTPEV